MTGTAAGTPSGDELLVAGAVTALFVPGDRPDRFAKAVTSGADIVIIDLEDAVAPDAKPAALRAVQSGLVPGHRTRRFGRWSGSTPLARPRTTPRSGHC